jgi:Pyruvate/2-oxoacid:ferredoxin oxidoreductase delta subunit
MSEALYVVSRQPTGAAQADEDCACACVDGCCGPSPLGLQQDVARHAEDEVIRLLAECGCDVLVLPHIYDMNPKDPALGRLRNHDGPITVLTWLHERPAHWTLHALEVPVEAVELVCMAHQNTPEDCLREAGVQPDAEGATPGAVEELDAPAPPRWYPVLDKDRCTECGQCLNFCLFGVYSQEEDRVVATTPDNCKPGCPACARVCPSAAIMFPHYADDPVIAGRTEDNPEQTEEEEGAGELQDLIDALEDLDD